MAKFFPVEWLFHWLTETVIFEFEWDVGNTTKNLVKHDVTVQEVEEVFVGRSAAALGVSVDSAVNEERLGIVGPTWKERLLTIVFTMRSGRVRPISARPAHRKERHIYDKIRKISKKVRKH